MSKCIVCKNQIKSKQKRILTLILEGKLYYVHENCVNIRIAELERELMELKEANKLLKTYVVASLRLMDGVEKYCGDV